MRGYDERGMRSTEAKHYSRNNYRRNGKHHALYPQPAASFHSVSEEFFKGHRVEENSDFIATQEFHSFLKWSSDTIKPTSRLEPEIFDTTAVCVSVP